MITFRGNDEEQKVAVLAELLGLDRSEVLRRAVNSYYARYEQEFMAYDWLAARLDALPGSGRADISERRRELLDAIYAERAGRSR
jgi:hypothetical protein